MIVRKLMMFAAFVGALFVHTVPNEMLGAFLASLCGVVFGVLLVHDGE